MNIEVTNPHLEYLCILHEDTGEVFVTQFHKPRSMRIQQYFEQWARSKIEASTPLIGKFAACIKLSENGAWRVVEKGFFKLTA